MSNWTKRYRSEEISPVYLNKHKHRARHRSRSGSRTTVTRQRRQKCSRQAPSRSSPAPSCRPPAWTAISQPATTKISTIHKQSALAQHIWEYGIAIENRFIWYFSDLPMLSLPPVFKCKGRNSFYSTRQRWRVWKKKICSTYINLLEGHQTRAYSFARHIGTRFLSWNAKVNVCQRQHNAHNEIITSSQYHYKARYPTWWRPLK